MSLPIRTIVEDVQAVCSYLATKPTGSTVKDAKAVLDPKHLDGRKLSALKFWGLIEHDEDRLKITEAGRNLLRQSGANRTQVLRGVIAGIPPYRAIIERAAHRNEDSLSATEVGAHWHDHFPTEASGNDKILNDQAVCFFHLAAAADLGSIVVGRKGAPTRFAFDANAVSQFVQSAAGLPAPSSGEPSTHIEDAKHEEPAAPLIPTTLPDTPPTRALGQGIFVAHGKNKKPLEQLKQILDQFKIPYKVAVDEPNLGRPIGSKIRDIMQACNCAILIFTADEEFQDKKGNVIWRPSENVIYELGAAGYLYDSRIVIMKEDDVVFPSNFRDLGHISFAKDQLDAKSMDVLKELIGFGIVKVST
jgi:hypothetical protein